MSGKVRKFAFLLSSLKFGGAERVALNLAKALKQQGFEVEILLMSKEGEFLAEAAELFDVVDLRCDRTWKLPGRLVSYLSANRPDVLICSFWKLNLGACCARLLHPRVRLLLWEHSPPSRSSNSPTVLYAITASLLYRLATKIVVVSSGVYEDVKKITVGLGPKLVVIFNPIPPPIETPADNARDRDRRKILWVGRLDEPKNPGLMLEAFALLRKGHAYALDFVGDGRLQADLERRRDALGLQDRVRFLGFRSDPYALMSKAGLLVVSSDREGLPSVIVEALYCGLRVVSTNCGEGIRDILLDNCYGTIVPVGDERALALAISRELDQPHDPRSQVEGARPFLPEEIVRQYLSALGLD
ncbi:MAG TPA: glycosyltransferase [Rhodothermales bacterium]|nr:glycosyltransferase [Rhodothermales bacterium]